MREKIRPPINRAADRCTVFMTAAEVTSPCINVCRMHPTSGWCEGCWRTLDEIAAWSQLDDAGRRAVLAQLPARRASNMGCSGSAGAHR